MNIIPIEALPGYDKRLEENRTVEFDAFMNANDNETKRFHFNRFAALTESRNPSLVNALDFLLIRSALAGVG